MCRVMDVLFISGVRDSFRVEFVTHLFVMSRRDDVES